MSYQPRGAGVVARTPFSPFHLVGVSAVALLCAMPQQAAAQQLTEAQSTILKRITVTAQRTGKSVLDVPQTVTVIDAETLARHQVRDIQDLVRYEPGITVGRQTSLVNPFSQLTSFNIRGVGGNRVQMLVDGSRVQEQITDGSRDFVDPWNMKAVELVRGPNSVLWGADALGGTVAMRTRDPSDLLDGTDKPWAVEIKTAWDSFDNSLRKQITGAYDFGDVQVMASFGHLGSEEAKLTKADRYGGIWGCPVSRLTYIGCDELFPADTNAYNGMLKGVWTPNDEHKVTATAELFSRETEIDQIWDSSAGSFYTSESYIRNLDMKRSRLALEHEWDVGADWLDSVKWNVSYSPQRRKMESWQHRVYPSRLQDNHQIRDYGEAFLEADVQMTSSFELGDTQHTLTYGFDGDLTNTDYESVNYSVRDPGGVQPDSTTGFNFPAVETVRADLYLQDEIKLFDERLTITPGVRLATYSIDPTVDEDYDPLEGFEPEKVESTQLIKKLSAMYKLDDSYSVYAAYGEGFKMPTSQQMFVSAPNIFNPGNEFIPNPDLNPESVVNYEAGIRGEFERGFFSVGGFYSEYENFITGPLAVPGETGKWSYYNYANVKLWGIEASAELEVVENLFLNGALNWSQGVQKTSPTAAETAYDGAVPLTVVAGLRYEMPDNGLEFEVIGTFGAGVTERSNPDAFKPDGYAVFDAFAKWAPTENIELTAGIQNIFDTRYFPNTLSGNYTNTPSSEAVAGQDPLELQTAPGRTFKLGATVKF